MKSTELQTQFYKEKGIEAFNSQGEPDIDYVQWLEEKVVLPQADVIKSVCEHTVDDLIFKNDNRAECKCGAEWHY